MAYISSTLQDWEASPGLAKGTGGTSIIYRRLLLTTREPIPRVERATPAYHASGSSARETAVRRTSVLGGHGVVVLFLPLPGSTARLCSRYCKLNRPATTNIGDDCTFTVYRPNRDRSRSSSGTGHRGMMLTSEQRHGRLDLSPEQ